MPGTTKKTAIVTGGSRGIGRAISLRLAADGYPVAINYVTRTTEADTLVAEITANGGSAIAIRADISNPDDTFRLFDVAEKELGPIGVVVNSAGILAMLPIAEADETAVSRIMSVNIIGTFNVMKQAARTLTAGGRIINFSSSVVGMSLPAYGPYAASKAAVEVLSRTLAHELRGRDINVNTVAPGPTATELFFEGKTEETVQRLAKLSPLERIGQPEEIAGAVAFLAGPDGTWVNAQTIRVNGGVV